MPKKTKPFISISQSEPPEQEVQDKSQPFIRRVKWQIVIPIAFLMFAVGVYIDFSNNSSLSANFADDVLRPLIGNDKTIALELVLFNGLDFVNRFRYKVEPPKDPFSTNVASVQGTNYQLNLTPISLNNYGFTPLAGEGIWQPINLSLFPNHTVLAKTFIRPDPKRPYAIASLVKMDMKQLRLSAVVGKVEPGGFKNPGPGKISLDVQNSNQLVAAFNGGFQEKDGAYGMIVGTHTYLPLKKDLATLVIDKDSHLKIIDYQGEDLGNDNIAIRQNGDMLLSNSVIVPLLKDDRYNVWGRTVTSNMYTWRSGIGITKQGNLVYAAGPSLVPQTLAVALLDAGAVNAMQLDINPFWVRFVVFDPIGNGKYEHTSLQKDMYDGGEQFLKGYQKDFFYLYKR